MTEENQTSWRINLSQCHFVHHKSQMEMKIISIEVYNCSVTIYPCDKCQYGTARLQVADGGTASDMEGSCEYTE